MKDNETGIWSMDVGERSILLYSSRQDGWRKGQPVLVNDVTIRIERGRGSSTDIEAVAAHILRAISGSHPTIKIELKRTASETPVPSHGGPAVAVTWELRLNGVVIQQSYDRYRWSDREKAGLKAPAGMQKRLLDLQAAIDGASSGREGDNE